MKITSKLHRLNHTEQTEQKNKRRNKMENQIENRSKQLYFVIKYNWKTKETSFCRYDESAAELYKNVKDDETRHRCSVWLSPIPGDHEVIDQSGIPITYSKEIYNESDRLDWRKITAYDVLIRLDLIRAFPIIPTEISPGKNLYINFKSEKNSNPKYQSQLVEF